MVRYREMKKSEYHRGAKRAGSKDHINSTERIGDVGRPTRWEQMRDHHESILIIIEHMAAAGQNETTIAESIGISHNTFINWKRQIVDVSEAVFRGKLKARSMLLSRTMEVAMGGMVIEDETVKETIGDDGATKVERVSKKLPPNPHLLRFLLEMYMKDTFTNSQKIELDANVVTHTEEDVRKAMEKYGITLSMVAAREVGDGTSEESVEDVQGDKEDE